MPTRRLTVNVNLLQNPNQGDQFGFQIANNGQQLTFSYPGELTSVGFNKTYVGASASVINKGRIMKIDANLVSSTSSHIGSVNNGRVTSIFKDPETAQIVLGGSFTNYQSQTGANYSPNRLIKLDETTDAVYGTYVAGPSGTVECLLPIDTTGFLVGGEFGSYEGFACNRLAFVSSTSNLSFSTFRNNIMSASTNKGFNNTVKCLERQPDGRILVGGFFTNFNNNPRNGLVRLNITGSLDNTFHDGFTGFDIGAGFQGGQVYCMKIDNSFSGQGRLYVGGSFTSYKGTPCNGLVRIYLSSAGVDTSFVYGTGFNGTVRTIELDGTDVLVGGEFTTYKGNTRNKIVRLTSGGIDQNIFGTGFGTLDTVSSINVNGGNLFIGGRLTTFRSVALSNFVKVNKTTGAYVSQIPLNDIVVTVKSFGSDIYLMGDFTGFNTGASGASTLYNIPIAADTAVNFGTGFNYAAGATVSAGTGFNNTNAARVAVKNPDDSLVVVGNFTTYNSIGSKGIVKINNTLGASITVGNSGTDGFGALPILSLARTTSGKYIVSSLGSYENVLYNNGLYRLNSNLTNDTSWNTGNFGPDATFPTKILTTPYGSGDSKTLIIDNTISDYDGNSITTGVYMLNENGNFDSSFTPAAGWSSVPLTMDVQGSNIIFAGNFTSYKGVATNRINKVDQFGASQSFNIGTGFNTGNVSFIKVASNSKIYCAGSFTSFNGTARAGFLRLNSDGSLDTGFTVGTGFTGGSVLGLVEDSLGNIYITGSFTSYNGTSINRIIRLTSSGTYDSTFVVGTGLNGNGNYIEMINTDKIVVMGAFTTYKSVAQPSIVMLDNIGTVVTTVGNFGDKIEAHKDPSGNFVAVGNFTTYNATASNQIVKVKYNGDIITAVGGGAGNGLEGLYTEKFVMKSNGYMVLFADKYEGVTASGKAIGVKNDMTVDTSFVSQGFNYTPVVKDVAVLQDNSFYLAGNELGYGAATMSGVSSVRISATGSLLNYLPLGSNVINTVDVCPLTGRVAIGGQFGFVGDPGLPFIGGTNSRNYENLIITAADGITIDNTMGSVTKSGGTSSVDKVKWSQDGRLMVTGNFNRYYNVGPSQIVSNIIRVNADGSLDPDVTANVTTGFNGTVNGISYINKYDPVNDIYNITPMIYGNFTTYNGVAAPYLVKLNENGSLNTSFQTGVGFNAKIDSAVIIDDNIIAMGSMASYNGVTLPSPRITMLDKTGLLTMTASGLYQTVQNTYDNFVAFHNSYGLSYSVVDTTVKVIYEFDEDEITILNVYDTPDYVEVTYINESLTINEIIDEVMVRSPYLVTTPMALNDTVNYKIKIYEGSLFDYASQSVAYNITKNKLFYGQSSIYVNINNLVREDLEANVAFFTDNNPYTATSLPDNMSKWVHIEETTLTGGTISDVNFRYLFATDGFLYNEEQQGVPNVLMSGDRRLINVNQPQRIYFQTNFLQSIKVSNYAYAPGVTYSGDYNVIFDVNLEIDNHKYVQSVYVDRNGYQLGFNFVEYTFTYQDASIKTVRFNFYNECKFDVYTLVFKNKFGVLESLSCSKKTTRSFRLEGTDFNRSILDYNGNYDINRHTQKEFNVDSQEQITLNTDWIPEYMVESVKELIHTEELWLIGPNGTIKPVLRIDDNFDSGTELNDRNIQYTIKVKLSHSTIKNIL